MITKNPQSSLPPGFRFHPTDEELILHYLKRKVTCSPLPVSIIAEVDIYKLNPWDLPAKAAFGEKEWYFFSPRDRKYPNGARPNRAAASGYWKATGTDKVIVASSSSSSSASAHQHHEKLGVKKALVFYKGRPPKGVKTNWIMHEYRLAESPTYNSRPNSNPLKLKDTSMRLDDWVLCRIYKKTNVSSSPTTASVSTPDLDQEEEEEEGLRYIHQNELKPLIDIPNNNVQSNVGLMSQKSSSFSNLLDAFECSMLSSFLSDNNPQLVNIPGFDQSTPLIPNYYNHVDMNEQNMFINGTCNNGSDDYFAQKLPQLSPSSSAPFTEENRLKRHHPIMMADTDASTNQAKRLLSHCSFTNTASQVADFPQYNSINSYPFLNQQLLLGPNNHSHFHG